jgi:glyoxylase-like metal-dependent hydrolase (beta-lactamase superfamily II)
VKRSLHAARSQLAWKHFPSGARGFFRAPVLLSGPSEALLIDGGFTYSDGRALADAVKSTGKKLTVIYISQSDPDYYFSLMLMCEAFPDAKVLAASAALVAIRGNIENKLAIWGPRLKENGPRTLAEVVLPEAFDGTSLTVDGEKVDIVAADGLTNRTEMTYGVRPPNFQLKSMPNVLGISVAARLYDGRLTDSDVTLER